MKKIFTILFLLTLGIKFTNAQVTIPGNLPPGFPAPFIGWNTLGGAIPLEIKTELPQDINFYTNAGAGTWANQAMIIKGNNNIAGWGANNFGYVGIGNIQPLSMLHIGNMNCFNGLYCPDAITPRAGWRPWMAVGTFMCGGNMANNPSDQMYVGLKNQGANDRDDAVINWGDNIGTNGNGPDNLRFIFSEYCADPNNDNVASGLNGLEVMRMMPLVLGGVFRSINVGVGDYFANAPVIAPMRRLEVLDGFLSNTVAIPPEHLNLPQFRLTYTQNANINQGIHTDFQSIGQTIPANGGVIGDLYITPVSSSVNTLTYNEYKTVDIDYPLIGGAGVYNPNLALDVNGQQDIKTVLQDTLLDHILVWDPTDAPTNHDGRIRWRPLTGAGGLIDAQNAAWINGTGQVEWGTNSLVHNTQIPMVELALSTNPGDEHNIYFTGQSTWQNAFPADIGIGMPNNAFLNSKIQVLNNTSTPAGGAPAFINTNAGFFRTTGIITPVGNFAFIGVLGRSEVTQTGGATITNMGARFLGINGWNNFGCQGIASAANPLTSNLCYGVNGLALNSGKGNYGGYFSAGFTPPIAPTGGVNFNVGVYGSALGNAATNLLSFGVYGDAGGGNWVGQNYWAGWFNGRVFTTDPGGWSPSDSTLKNSINTLTNDSAIYLIRNLNPKTYVFDTASNPSMNLPRQSQIGLISQEVQTMLPQLVTEAIQPAYSDTLGTRVYDSVKFLAIDYTGFIPILIGAVKEIDSSLSAQPSGSQNGVWVDTLNKYEWGTNTLLHNTEIPMLDDSLNEWNIYFTGQSQMQSGNPADVGIGYSTDSMLKGKIDVLNKSSTESESYQYTNLYAGRFNNTGYGIGTPEHWGSITDILGEHFAAVYGKSNVMEDDENLALMNIGGDFTAGNSTVNVGVRNIIGYVKTPGAISNIGTLSIVGSSQVAYGTYSMAVGAKVGSIGVYGSAYNGRDYNYGVWGQTAFEHDSTTAAGIANYAVYGELGDSGATTPDFAGYFNGDLGTTAGFYQVSDSKFKKDIKPFDGNSAMDLINQLQPKTYSFDNRKFKSMALPFGSQYGLLSDDVEKVLPGLIKNSIQAPKTDQYGKVLIPYIEYKALNYTGLIPILVAGVKEVDSTNNVQQQQNEQLQNQVSTLQQQLNELKLQMQQISDCCHQQTGTNNPTGMNTGGVNQTVVELNNYAIILDQNSPNPFAEQTTITFKIPVAVKDAQLIFSDNKGVVIKTVQINSRGEGSLLVYASNLSSGIYSYSLLADGKLIDTKQMILTKY